MSKMQTLKEINLPKNMGKIDRIIRSAIGGALLANGLSRPESPLCRVGAVIGGAFLFYGMTGYDPLLQAAKSTTLPDDPKNLIRKVKNQAMVKGQTILDSLQESKITQVSGV